MKKLIAYFLKNYDDEPLSVYKKTKVLIISNLTCVIILMPIIIMHYLSDSHALLLGSDLLFIALMLGPFFLIRQRKFEAAANLIIFGVAFVIVLQNPVTDLVFDTYQHYNRCLETSILFMAAIVLVALFAYKNYQIVLLVSLGMMATLVHFIIIINKHYDGHYSIEAITFIVTYLFIMFLAGILSRFLLVMYNDLISIAEGESRKVKIYNQTLELKVAERTKELEVQNDELKKVNSELDRFVYSVSHDLRAPLLSTLGLIDICRQEKDESQRSKYLELMQKSIKKLDSFIIDIINLSKNARLELQKEAIQFEDLINSILEEHSYMEQAHKIHYSTQINQQEVFVTDNKRLTIVLNNIISNAIRYSNPHQETPFVQINIEADAKSARIEISDNGIGIAQEHIDKIFQMFYRASTNKSGSGLGLYIVKETIAKLQGTIQVKSEPGKGSSFIIQLPSLQD